MLTKFFRYLMYMKLVLFVGCTSAITQQTDNQVSKNRESDRMPSQVSFNNESGSLFILAPGGKHNGSDLGELVGAEVRLKKDIIIPAGVDYIEIGKRCYAFIQKNDLPRSISATVGTENLVRVTGVDSQHTGSGTYTIGRKSREIFTSYLRLNSKSISSIGCEFGKMVGFWDEPAMTKKRFLERVDSYFEFTINPIKTEF